jgi:ParB family transcriptional regulator, chromosome partitioning protein
MPRQTSRPSFDGKLERHAFFGTSSNLPRIVEVELANLRPNPDQPRTAFDPASIQELADSINQHGIIQPIAVTKDPHYPDDPTKFLIVAGERRYRAFQLLERETIPAVITAGNPAEIALIENIQRENLHPLDEAYGLANLMQKHGYTQEEVSKVVAKSRPTINEILRLTALSRTIQQECRTFDIPKSTLVAIARVGTEEQQLALWEQIKQGGMTVREARATKKGISVPRMQRYPIEKALDVGRNFVQSLQRAALEEVSLANSQLRELQTLRDQINVILDQFAVHAQEDV